VNTSACPHCGKHCLGFWSKISLGPIGTKGCVSCGASVSVHWLLSGVLVALMSVASLAGGLLSLYAMSPLPLGWFTAVFVLGSVLTSVPLLWLYYRFVPLVARAT
jgi:hypothetical protein